MLMLRSISRIGELDRGHPFDLPLVKEMETIELESPVTFLVGENGAGKSTLLESVAIAAQSITAGGTDLETDPTLESSRRLADCLRLSWSRRTKRGFFMRAEDFFGFTKRITQTRLDLQEMNKEFEEEFEGHARDLATGVTKGQSRALARYGMLETSSHGEGFLHFFKERFVPGGFYLMDEPEAALSPQRQLAFLAMIKEMVEEGSQFIIATHSPIIMALPDSTIYSLDTVPPAVIKWKDTDHVQLTRDFLAAPERYLKHL